MNDTPNRSAGSGIPFSLDPFVGRTADLAEIQAMLRDGSRLVTIYGPPGVGKTRLATEFIGEHCESLSRVFVDLSMAVTSEDIAVAVADVVGVSRRKRESTADFAARLGETLGQHQPMLLVLDNLEQVAGAAGSLIRTWLELARDLTVLATSRLRLGVPGERLYELGPLALPPADVNRFEALTTCEAGRFFVDRVRAVRTGWCPDSAEVAKLVSLIRRLDGLPLALELAAARMNFLGVDDLMSRLESSSGGLAGYGLKASVECSWVLLNQVERCALAQCAVLRGGFDLAAADAVIDLRDCGPGASVLGALQGLRDQSLLRVVEIDQRVRLSLLSTIRAFAQERLEATYDARAARLRHAEYFAGWSEELAMSPSDTISRFTRERDNLRAVIEDSALGEAEVDVRIFEEGVRTALVLRPVLSSHGVLHWHRQWFEAILVHPLAAVVNPDLVFEARMALCSTLRNLGRYSDALALLENAVEPADQAGRIGVERAFVLGLSGDLRACAAVWDRARPTATASGNLRLTALSHHLAASLASAQGDFEQAAGEAVRAADAHRANGDVRSAAWCRAAGARALVGMGRPEMALDAAMQAISEARLRDAPATHSLALLLASDALAAMGRHAEAKERCREALARFSQGDDERMVAESLICLAGLELDGREFSLAEVSLERAIALLAKQENGPLWAEAHLARARCAALQGGGETARRFANEAVRASHGHPTLETTALSALAVHEATSGHGDAARRRFDSLSVPDDAPGWLRALVDLRRLHMASGGPRSDTGQHDREALRCLFEARATRPGQGPDPQPRWLIVERAFTFLCNCLPASERNQGLLEANDPDSRALCVGADASWYRAPGGDIVFLGHSQNLRRLLDALVVARLGDGRDLALDDLVTAVWPRERILPNAATNRVYVTVTKLRKTGLGTLVERGKKGYRLDHRVPVVKVGSHAEGGNPGDHWQQLLVHTESHSLSKWQGAPRLPS